MLHMLSTVDNPFNPWTQFDEWLGYDEIVGQHHTSAYLARVARTSHDLSEADEELAIEQAIDEIVKSDPLGIFIKVSNTN